MSSASETSPLLALKNQEPKKSLDAKDNPAKDIVDIGGASNDEPDGKPDGAKAVSGQDTSAASSTHAPVGPEPRHTLGEEEDFEIDFVDDDGDDVDESTDDVVVVDQDEDQLDEDELGQMPMPTIDSDDPIDQITDPPAPPLGEDDEEKENDAKANNDKKLEEARRRRARLVAEEDENNDKKPAFLKNNDKKNNEKKNDDKSNNSKKNNEKKDNNDKKNNDKKIEVTVKESRQPMKIRMSVTKDVNALFAADQTLSEDFKVAAKTIFESALKRKVRAMGKALNEAYAAKMIKQSRSLQNNIVNKIDQFMDYVVEEWMKENRVAVQHGLKTEIMEDLFSGLKNLLAENYIDIPDNKVNVVTALTSQVEKLEQRLNEAEQKNIQFKQRLVAERKQNMIGAAKAGLALTEQAEFEKLAKEVKFKGNEDFAGKLQTLKESYFGKKRAPKATTTETAEQQMLTEQTQPTKKQSQDPVVDQVLNVARRMGGPRK